MTAAPAGRSRLASIAGLRCPRCREGRVFATTWRMNEACPRCGLRFTRGSGYFTGAMYFSYALGIPLIAALTLLVYLVAPAWSLWQDVLVAWVLFLPLAPAVFRYSRVLWIHFDQYFDPAPPAAGAGHSPDG
jgi:uncharacterized protein (DUF983 family)